MRKIGAAASFLLAVAESVLGFQWFAQAREHNWDPRRIFFGAIAMLNSLMLSIIACGLWNDSLERTSEDWDDFEEDVYYED